MDDDTFGELAYEDELENTVIEEYGAFDDTEILDFTPADANIGKNDDDNILEMNGISAIRNRQHCSIRSKTGWTKSAAFKRQLPSSQGVLSISREIKNGSTFSELGNINKDLLKSSTDNESLFQSVSPIDWHLKVGEEEMRSKRRRIDVENAIGQATLQILTARMARCQHISSTFVQHSFSQITHGTSGNSENRTKLFEVPPTDGFAWYGVSTADGRMHRYLSTRRRQRINRQEQKDSAKFDDFLQRIEENRQKCLMKMDEQMAEEKEHHVFYDNDNKKAFGLWTDKYMPKNFLDLLTSNETNRLVLLWLHLWGSRNILLDEKDSLVEIEQQKGGYVLPKQKILVLYGSSGAGKSSLASIAARQAGYQPFILSISEYQNVTELRNRLDNTTNSTAIQVLFRQSTTANDCDSDVMKSVKTNLDDAKPICFIIEELEMASAEMIQFLCNWSRRSGRGIIKRPIICTCANIWHNSLKELRGNALSLRVPQCRQERLERRLTQICHWESIQLDKDQLSDLIQSHGADIRLCLNTLQFMTANARSSHKQLTKKANLTHQNRNHEPMNTASAVSMLNVLSAIFTLDFHADNRGIIRSPKDRIRSLLNLLGQLPQEDFVRLQQLLFVNYASVLKLSYKQCRRISQLFVQMDQLQSRIILSQCFSLGRYLPYILLVIHLTCAVHVSPRLQFNMAVQSFNERLRDSQQIVRAIRIGAAANQHYVQSRDIRWLLAHLHCVLQPPIQPANSHLFSSQDQRQLQRIVQLMHHFHLKYVTNFINDMGLGNTGVEERYCFDPPIDLLTTFPLPQGRQHFSLAETIKKSITYQIEMASIQRKKQNIKTSRTREHTLHMGNEDNDDQRGVKAPPQLENKDESTAGTNEKELLRRNGHFHAYDGGSPFTFRYSTGSSQAIRRRVLIDDIFK